MMQHLGRLALMSCFCVLISGQLDDSKFSERPYDVLQNQNLVILGSVFGILLVIMAHEPREPLPTTGARAQRASAYTRTSPENLYLQAHEPRAPLPTGVRAKSACTSPEILYPQAHEPRVPPHTGTSQ
ncbi:unnamed protein product [Gadus morhua 'NCC']